MIPFARCLAAALLAGFFLSLIPPSPALARTVPVTGIRCWTNEEYTRVAIDVGGEVRHEAKTLPADPARKLPPRIFVDIADADIREEILRRPVDVSNGLLKVVRAGRFRKGVVRVVIDLERESGYRVFEMSDPFRIIVDIEGHADGNGAAPGPAAEAEAGSGGGAGVGPEDGRDNLARRSPQSPQASHPRPGSLRGRTRVMLDPGHGGRDPGAIGPSGLREKDVTLAIGRLVRQKLLASGEYDVRMTRDSDVFVPLEERTAMANRARAELFVSLHINASPNRRAQGISTYVLSRSSSDREALELAARENGVSVRKLSAVKFIIDDLSTAGRKNESLRLAKTVNDAIVRNVKSRFGPVEDLGLKQAPFYVLVGARMTAILLESSFISNPREESRLTSPAYLETIADSVVEAIRFYGAKKAVASARP